VWEVEAECQARLLSAAKFGAFDPAGLPDAVVKAIFQEPLWLMRARLEQFRKIVESDHVLSRIKFAINGAPTVNAFAILDPEYPLISLNAGFCVRVRQLMHHAVHNSEVLKSRKIEEGFPKDAIEEALDLAPAAALLQPVDLAAGQDENAYFAMAAPLAPSKERFELAQTLTTAALDFIVLHEVCHILRNQGRFYENSHHLSFNEAEAAGPTSENAQLLRQALELDADLAAGPENARQFGGGRGITPGWRKWTDDGLEVLGLWLLSLCLTFFLLDTWRENADPKLSTHPLPRVRLMLIMSIVLDNIADWQLEMSQRELFGFVVETHRQAAEIWNSLGLPEKSSVLATSEVVNEYRFYIDLLAKHGLRGAPSD
jgi:hypothetical protein